MMSDELELRRGVSRFCVSRLGMCAAPYRYSRRDNTDDFEEVADRILAHSQIVFATPVYWNAMSGGMKTFFDRLTDLTQGRAKHEGRGLSDRSMWLLATGTDRYLPSRFTDPFAGTAAYLGMIWREAACVRSDRQGGSPS